MAPQTILLGIVCVLYKTVFFFFFFFWRILKLPDSAFLPPIITRPTGLPEKSERKQSERRKFDYRCTGCATTGRHIREWYLEHKTLLLETFYFYIITKTYTDTHVVLRPPAAAAADRHMCRSYIHTYFMERDIFLWKMSSGTENLHRHMMNDES